MAHLDALQTLAPLHDWSCNWPRSWAENLKVANVIDLTEGLSNCFSERIGSTHIVHSHVPQFRTRSHTSKQVLVDF